MDDAPETVLRLLSMIDSLPTLNNEDRQELRVITWESYVSFVMAYAMISAKSEVRELESWYTLPAAAEHS
jgi:hypothetical protein